MGLGLFWSRVEGLGILTILRGRSRPVGFHGGDGGDSRLLGCPIREGPKDPETKVLGLRIIRVLM